MNPGRRPGAPLAPSARREPGQPSSVRAVRPTRVQTAGRVLGGVAGFLPPGASLVAGAVAGHLQSRGAQVATRKGRRRVRRAILGKNMPSHRMLTRLRRYSKRWTHDAQTILTAFGHGRKIPRRYKGYGRRAYHRRTRGGHR